MLCPLNVAALWHTQTWFIKCSLHKRSYAEGRPVSYGILLFLILNIPNKWNLLVVRASAHDQSHENSSSLHNGRLYSQSRMVQSQTQQLTLVTHSALFSPPDVEIINRGANALWARKVCWLLCYYLILGDHSKSIWLKFLHQTIWNLPNVPFQMRPCVHSQIKGELLPHSWKPLQSNQAAVEQFSSHICRKDYQGRKFFSVQYFLDLGKSEPSPCMIDEFPVKNILSILQGSHDRELCHMVQQWADNGGVIQG